MELRPPVGWADIATKQDVLVVDQRLDRVEQRLEGVDRRLDELASEIRAQTWKLMTLMVAVVGVVVAAVRL